MLAMKKHSHLLIATGAALLLGALFIYLRSTDRTEVGPVQTVILPPVIATSTVARNTIINVVLPSIPSKVTKGIAQITDESPKIFAYAHATAEADGKLFVGMVAAGGNPFVSNEVLIFGDPADISHPSLVTLPAAGEISTMVYDRFTDRVYLDLSGNNALKI